MAQGIRALRSVRKTFDGEPGRGREAPAGVLRGVRKGDELRQAARRAVVANNGPHILRHTFCSHLAMRGAAPRAIQELAGHSEMSTTQRYMHLSPAAIESAIRLLDGNMVATICTGTAKGQT